MKLSEFLKQVNGRIERIVIIKSQKEAMEAVERNGYALQYVNPNIFEEE